MSTLTSSAQADNGTYTAMCLLLLPLLLVACSTRGVNAIFGQGSPSATQGRIQRGAHVLTQSSAGKNTPERRAPVHVDPVVSSAQEALLQLRW